MQELFELSMASHSPQGKVVLRSTRVVTPEGVRPADVVLEGERIREVREHGSATPARPETLLELGDEALLPALIDVHVHVNDPPPSRRASGGTGAGEPIEWEGFRSASRAAAAGGIGLLVDMPLNSEPVTTTIAALEEKIALACRRSRVDVAFHAGVVPENADDGRRLADLALAGAAAFKCFLCDSGLASFPPIGREDLRAAMGHLAHLGRRLLAHAEVVVPFPTQAPAAAPGGRRYADYLASRPPEFELDAIAMLLELARETGCAVHVVHLATARALPLLAAARAEGLDVTVETCPHYLTFSAEEIADGETVAKCAPPIRDAANREGLWAGLASGGIDFVATDHSPCPPAMKHLGSGDFGTAWGGIASLQLLLPALWTGARARGFGLEQLTEWLSARPAKWLGLADRGAIRAGARADLVALRPEESFVVRGAALFHRHATTPYEGRELVGVVSRTWLAGQRIDDPALPSPGRPLRLRGGFTSGEERGFVRLARVPLVEARALLAPCCGSRRWLDPLLETFPPASARALFAESERAFDLLTADDWREAFDAHPRIGDLAALRAKAAAVGDGGGREAAEQAGAVAADEATLAALAEGNRRYERRFGHVFLICASGRSAAEMLAALELRLANDAASELAIAAEEQRKITVLRLERMLRGLDREGA